MCNRIEVSTYQAQNASMKPNHEKKKTRPYMSKGLKNGKLLAFLLIGLTLGALHRRVISNPMVGERRLVEDSPSGGGTLVVWIPQRTIAKDTAALLQ